MPVFKRHPEARVHELGSPAAQTAATTGAGASPRRAGRRGTVDHPSDDRHAASVAENDAQGLTLAQIPELVSELREILVYEVSSAQDHLQVEVLEGNESNPLVLTWVSRARHAGWRVRVVKVDAEAIRLGRERMEALQRGRLSSEDSAVIGSVLRVLTDAADMGCSDIHFELRGDYADVVFRLDGRLHRFSQLPGAKTAVMLRAIYQSMASVSDRSFRPGSYQAAQITERAFMPDNVSAVRVQSGPMLGGQFMVLRLLYHHVGRKRRPNIGGHTPPSISLDDGVALFQRFGYLRQQARILARLSRQPQGIVIFSGPTGSGKSSSLKTALDFQHRRYPEKSIITVEDPTEFIIPGAKQLPVLNAETDQERRSKFAEALRVALRSDPDILMVGEVRDEVSAAITLDAAITGHQMWTTVHTFDPFSIVTRLRRFGLHDDDFLDASLLTGLVGQRLVPKLCDACKLPLAECGGRLDSDLKEALHLLGDDALAGIYMPNPQGCETCGRTGVSGRVLVAQVIEVSDELVMQMREDVRVARREWIALPDSVTLIEHALMHVLAGNISPPEVVAGVGDFSAYLETHAARLRSLVCNGDRQLTAAGSPT